MDTIFHQIAYRMITGAAHGTKFKDRRDRLMLINSLPGLLGSPCCSYTMNVAELLSLSIRGAVHVDRDLLMEIAPVSKH